MTDRSRKQKATIPSRNPFVSGAGSEWAQAARACQILTLVERGQVGRKSLCMCNLWRQNNWRRQQIIRMKAQRGNRGGKTPTNYYKALDIWRQDRSMEERRR